METDWPLSFGEKSPPVMAMKVSVVNRSVGPARQNSSTGSFALLLKSRLAICDARLSITPEGEKPLPRYPRRPSSWMVVQMPGLITVKPISCPFHDDVVLIGAFLDLLFDGDILRFRNGDES